MTYFLIKVAQWLWDQKTMVLAVFAFFLWVTDIAQKVVIAGFYKIFELISNIDLSQLQEADFATLEYIGVGNALLPLSEMAALSVIYYTLWTSLIALRWMKSFLPTIAN